MFLLLWERENGGVGKGEVKRERQRNVDVRNIDLLPPKCSPTGSRTCNLGMCSELGYTYNLSVFGVMIQPTEPPSQGYFYNS